LVSGSVDDDWGEVDRVVGMSGFESKAAMFVLMEGLKEGDVAGLELRFRRCAERCVVVWERGVAGGEGGVCCGTEVTRTQEGKDTRNEGRGHQGVEYPGSCCAGFTDDMRNIHNIVLSSRQ
jgi:hypothetical protein